MVVSYFRLALRHLYRNATYAFISIASLTLSLSFIILIVLYAKDELSFDKFHGDIESLYIIAIDVRNADGSSFDKMALTGISHGPRFKEKLPEIESFVRLNNLHKDVKLGSDVTSQSILEADNNFFLFFNFPLLQGNAATALLDIHSIVISEDLAITHFGTRDAIGKTILIQNEGRFIAYNVTAVSERCPQNSSIQFEAVIPFQGVSTPMDWVTTYLTTFIKVGDLSDRHLVESKMQDVFEAESSEAMKEVRSHGFTQSFYHQLLPFEDIHLSQDFQAIGGLSNASSPIYSYVLSAIGLFLLIIACINFVNLSIARSLRRAKEIGIRKVAGGQRRQLVAQFLGESFLLCTVSFFVAIVCSQLLLPLFNSLVNKKLSLSYLIDADLIILYLVLLVLTGFLAGFYPAIVLSGFKPVQVLYTRLRPSRTNYLQRALIVFQFALATLMIIGTVTITRQLQFLTTKDLGYDPNNVIKLRKRNLSPLEARTFTEELSDSASVLGVAPVRHGKMVGKINGGTLMQFTYEVVGPEYIELLKISLAQGKGFSSLANEEFSNSVIINEAFAREAGWKDPLEQEVIMMDGSRATVIGVVRDYHYESLQSKIEPQLFSMIFDPEKPSYEHLLIRIQPGSESGSVQHIASTFKKLFPLSPFSYEYLEDANLLRYDAELRWKKIISVAALVTVLIACTGLFGLSILTAESRLKEIGIRKVLGASVKNIAISIYREHLILVSVALVISIPLCLYLIREWLNNYPYRIEVGMEAVAGVGVLVSAIVLVTVSYHTVKAALSNPVESLRRE